jgi:hypothetical protein
VVLIGPTLLVPGPLLVPSHSKQDPTEPVLLLHATNISRAKTGGLGPQVLSPILKLNQKKPKSAKRLNAEKDFVAGYENE